MDYNYDFKVPAAEIKRRMENIQWELRKNGIGGLWVVQRVDLFYFSGTAQHGFLYVPAEGKPLLFIKRYFPRARWESFIEDIIEIKSVREIPGIIIDRFGSLPRTLGYELDVMPVNDFRFYRNLFKASEHADASLLILKARRIKSEWEIARMEDIAEMSRKTFEYIKTIIRPGISEMEFAGMFEVYARKLGHGAKLRVRHYLDEIYTWHVLSGPSGGLTGALDASTSGEGTSPAFPVGAGYRKFQVDEPIMIDLGLVLNGYHIDETRMFAIGSMPDKALKASQAAIEIHNLLLERIKPGAVLGELFDYSVKLAEKMGYAEAYLGSSEYKASFIGHGIGLEFVEPYIIAKNKKERMEPGMIFALEPKIMYKNEFAAGIESVFLVTETANRLISKVPVEIFIRPAASYR